jgi:hypothetical protein
MGFFKSQRELYGIAKDIERNSPPVGERMANAQAKMAETMQAMAAQTEAANMAMTVAANGVPASITVVSVTQNGMLNFNPMLQLEVTVMPDGRAAYPASVPLTINQMQAAAVQPGKTFTGKVDANDPSVVWIDPTSVH